MNEVVKAPATASAVKSLDEVCEFLRSVKERPDGMTSLAMQSRVAELKRAAASQGNEAEAKSLWCIEQALRVQDTYIGAFQKLKDEKFYEAWCDLEQAEIGLASLEPHDQIGGTQFCLDFIREYVQKWQWLFPYRMFMSPEMLALEKICSICQRPISPRNPCGHRVGEIYRGEMCCRIVKDLRLLGMSLVTNPVQKYSVAFLSDPETGERRDQYNYTLVKYAISALRRPFDEWSTEHTTRRQPLSRFSDVGRNDPCPCQSGKKFKKCCLPGGGVLRPHVQFSFSTIPPETVLPEVWIP